jgi:PAS domain S-box-containing protein
MLYREFFELSPDASLVFVAGTVTHANPAAARLFGADSVTDLIGRRSTELLHPDYVPEVERRVAVFMQERVQSLRASEKYIRFDGTEVEVETVVARAKFLDGKAFFVSLRDVSSRRESERRLREPKLAPIDRRPPFLEASAIVREWAARYHLTSAEAFVLRNALRGRSRDAITALLRVAPSTLKKHAHNLIQKTGDPSLNGAVQRALREAMGLEYESSP